MQIIARLKELYNQDSKHSNYQLIHASIAKHIAVDSIRVNSRYEQERLAYIGDNVALSGKSVLDVGGNTGFFTFSALEQGALSVDYFEGNKNHAEFVELSSRLLGVEKNISVNPRYYDFSSGESRYDVVFLLNVIHHYGDDYGDGRVNMDQAKSCMLEQLNKLAGIADTLVFQMGFCWQGDVGKPLFARGTKGEMIDFIQQGTGDAWETVKIGIAERRHEGIVYADLSEENIGRDDSLGEFLNRPIFIMKSRGGLA